MKIKFIVENERFRLHNIPQQKNRSLNFGLKHLFKNCYFILNVIGKL